ncbi:alpha/beta hydrolase [Sphingomonas sp. RP10(2022)]|uniref:Alpha/beta hydrolase n=1 Tax=Sphingomonas liriopis TaxID=2949094 RepID=A0A9X2KS74_9SPHN|nr:alpha/beta hydrolase [Sphingomonas liriopis]MCP3733513.1 alpha/beta hydrolase [Sphingomonas liriopis]
MALDPMIEGMLSQQPAWPPVRGVPLQELRANVRATSIQIPPPAVTLASVADRAVPSPAGDIPVRVYTPEGAGPFPVVVYFHGGGFILGDLDTQDMIARGLAGGAGALVVSVDYRLAPEHPFPAATDDGYAVVQWIAAHGAEIGGDPARIAVAGDSAGGVLAYAMALQALNAGGPRLAAVVNWYGPAQHPVPDGGSMAEFADGPIVRADDAHYFHELYITDPAQDGDYRVSATRAPDHRGLPPHLIGSAECDPLRDVTEMYAPVLRAAGVEVEVKRYPGMVHGFVSWVGFLPGAQTAMADACAFLKRAFAD